MGRCCPGAAQAGAHALPDALPDALPAAGTTAAAFGAKVSCAPPPFVSSDSPFVLFPVALGFQVLTRGSPLFQNREKTVQLGKPFFLLRVMNLPSAHRLTTKDVHAR